MDYRLEKYFHDFEGNGKISSEQISENLQKHLDFLLPEDYVDFMCEFNGGEGGIGENGWLCLFPIHELIEINKAYQILMDQIPDYFLIAKDAADTGYALHKRNRTYHSFGLMSNFETDSIDFCGGTFLEFIETIANE